MCGILLVHSALTLDHTPALELLKQRGPDMMVTKQVGKTFVAQSVLHVTGSAEFYHQSRDYAFAYNGEIYNYPWFDRYSNDVELAYNTVKNNIPKFSYFEGPWAWAWANSDTVLYASDPQGERCLYHYQDDDMLIVCSEVAPILTYISAKHNVVPYRNKCWTMISQTPWQGVTRCQPGMLYRLGQPEKEIDSVWSWINDRPLDIDLETATTEFEKLWDRASTICRVQEPATLSYSGGIDSTLIKRFLPTMQNLAVDCDGKDPVIQELDCEKILIDPQGWAEQYRELIRETKMPAQTWSYVGKWLIAKHSTNRIIYTGLGADELFGGYEMYRDLIYTEKHSTSPYSIDDHDGLWQKCLDVYQGNPKQATLLMDYWYQVVGVDAPGLDRLGGRWSKETRNPFLLKSIMQFALNLPIELKISSPAKPVLRNLLLKYKTNIFPKQGFAGHANDSLPWLGINIDSSGNRYQDWQLIAQKTFYEYTRPH